LDVHFFFEGGNREVTSSAFLATLLEQDASFLHAFLAHAAPGLDVPRAEPEVFVERTLGGGAVDVLLKFPSAVVLVENKVDASAKRQGQLRQYYVGAALEWPDKRLAAVYLAPSDRLGRSEIDDVRLESARLRRQGDMAHAIDWMSVESIARDACSTDKAFARDGFSAVRRLIELNQTRVYIDWDGESFLEESKAYGPAATTVVGSTINWLNRPDPLLGHGKLGPLYITVPSGPTGELKVGHVEVTGNVNVTYGNLRTVAPFDDPAMLVALVRRLNAIPAMQSKMIAEDQFERWNASWISPVVLGQPGAMTAFSEVLDWVRAAIAESGAADAR
jgi:hypothetical protein